MGILHHEYANHLADKAITCCTNNMTHWILMSTLPNDECANYI